MPPIVHTAGGSWGCLMTTLRVCFGLLAAIMVFVFAMEPDVVPAERLGAAALMALLAWGVPALFNRRAPVLRMTDEGIEGPGIPGVVPWTAVRDVGLGAMRVGRAEHPVLCLDLVDEEARLAALPAFKRLDRGSMEAVGLTPFAYNLAMFAAPPAQIAAEAEAFRAAAHGELPRFALTNVLPPAAPAAPAP